MQINETQKNQHFFSQKKTRKNLKLKLVGHSVQMPYCVARIREESVHGHSASGSI